jgi:hypothetical protein
MTSARYFRLFAELGVAVLTLGALATSGYAQSAFQGKFTLAVETHWEGATLPPGDYTITLPSNSAPYTIYLQGQNGSAIIQAVTAEDRVLSNRPQLNLVKIEDMHTVQKFEAPGLGVTLVYRTPTQKPVGHKEACQKKVPQPTLAPQVSENKTSVEVHTTGR